MFTSAPITVGFIAMWICAYCLMKLDKLSPAVRAKWRSLIKSILVVGVLAALYCIAAGLVLLNGWVDPLSAKMHAEMNHTAVSHSGKGGIVILMITFWPYALIGLGGLSAGAFYITLKRINHTR